MDSNPLQRFIGGMDALANLGLAPAEMAEQATRLLPAVLARPACLPGEYRGSNPEHYEQHIVHVHSGGKYSVVALVWLPGQATPVHDHRCWCVVGVLEGLEHETRYSLRRSARSRLASLADSADEWLEAGAPVRNASGSVSVLVPPEENIHQVVNGSDTLAVSIHVYGADIGVLGTSINKVFTQPIRAASPVPGTDASWRMATSP